MSFPLRVSNEGLLPVLTRPPSRRGDAAFPNRPAFNDTNDPTELARFSVKGVAWISPQLRTSNDINDPSKLARFTFLAGGPIGLPLRASNVGYLLTRIQRGSWCGLHCAHRATLILLNDPSKLACFSSLGRARMLVYVRPSNEALLRRRVLGAWGQRGCPSNPFRCEGSTDEKSAQPQFGRHALREDKDLIAYGAEFMTKGSASCPAEPFDCGLPRSDTLGLT